MKVSLLTAIVLTVSISSCFSQHQNIRYKRYTKISKALRNVEKVKYLDLSNKQLEALPLEIFIFTKLKVLKLNNNKLTIIPDEVKKLIELEVIILSHNNIKELTKQIFELRNLRLIDLRNNELSTIPNELAKLVNLKFIDLSFNPISYDRIVDIRISIPNCTIQFNH